MSHHLLKTVVASISLLLYVSCSVDAPDTSMEMDFSPVLSNPNVTAITQDKDGFIWIGTANGLNRYDGSEYRRYFHGRDSNSLSDNAIQDIYLDSKERIWAASVRGISLYDRERDDFKTIPNTTTSNNFKDVVQTSDGTLFFNSVLQIAKYDEDSDVIVPVYDITIRMFNTRLFVDRYDNLWYFNGSTLCCVDSHDLSLKGEYDVGGYVLCGEILPNDVILLGTYNGLKVFDINRRIFSETDEALSVIADSFVDNIGRI